ncbi:hypothetical protein GWI33_014990 [Rhynchophorus ferrugineus]|uniref:Uncharacterized protein n=1 Tax=Rhynchophorus ferrugineus TaxID=354439 RepID=A0A834I0K7_RHYFE|nr:hypothetical protein GWI33_014990 [Rhynchophorus ferrugineus]
MAERKGVRVPIDPSTPRNRTDVAGEISGRGVETEAGTTMGRGAGGWLGSRRPVRSSTAATATNSDNRYLRAK